ncbi:MAG: ABC transporter substrate-binding protein [Deltaproteobacteria bacterium]|nr:ABC transporter substrate-binding protein [Deltaproteobacteria bacterium]
MSEHKSDRWSRREFLSTAALAGTGTLLGLKSELLAAEPPPETTRLRLGRGPSACWAPIHLADELLLGEGFTDVQHVRTGGTDRTGVQMLSSGQVDIAMGYAAPRVRSLDAGEPIVVLAGVHVGCFEVFGTDRVRTIRDLKGKRVAVTRIDSPSYLLVSIIMANVGLDPRKDVNWVTGTEADSVRLLAEKKIDAVLVSSSTPPYAQELRAKRIGHVILSSMMDRPWSNYFCCLLAASREFVRKHPVATKRALRAILKRADVIAREPERTARTLVEKGYVKNDDYEYVYQMLKEIPYGQWREYEPEDTLRFYALRLHEVGMIKSSPQKIIAQGTDWRFLKELKKELKT